LSGGIDADQPLGELEGALGLGAVGQEPAGLPAQGWRSFPHAYSVEQYTIMAWKRVRATTCAQRALPSTAARGGRVAWCPHPSTSTKSRPVGQLGAKAHGEVLEAGRVPDCYLGLRLDPAGEVDTGRAGP
jgi:hypothetical protein